MLPDTANGADGSDEPRRKPIGRQRLGNLLAELVSESVAVRQSAAATICDWAQNQRNFSAYELGMLVRTLALAAASEPRGETRETMLNALGEIASPTHSRDVAPVFDIPSADLDPGEAEHIEGIRELTAGRESGTPSQELATESVQFGTILELETTLRAVVLFKFGGSDEADIYLGSPILAAAASALLASIEHHWKVVGNHRRADDWHNLYQAANLGPRADRIAAEAPRHPMWATMSRSARVEWLQLLAAPYRLDEQSLGPFETLIGE